MARSLKTVRVAGVVTAAALAFSLAACSDDSAATTATGNAADSNLTGDPVNVGFIDTLSGTAFADPSQTLVVKMAVDEVNATGGINGRPLNVITCDTKGSASNGLACARDMVEKNKVVAFLGGNSSGGIAQVGQNAGVVSWGPMGDDPSDVANPESFIIDTSAVGAGNATYLGAKRFDAKSGAVIGMQGADAFNQQAVDGFKKAGVDNVELIVAPPVADYTPYLQKVKDSGADVWTILATSATIGPAISQATQLGITQPLVAFDNAMSNEALEALSQATFPNSLALEKAVSDDVPVWKEYEDQLKKYAPGGKIDNPTDGSVTGNWINTWSFAQEARKISGDVTAASFRDHLNALTAFDSGVQHVMDFTTPGPVPGMPRHFNLWSYPGHARGGKTVLDDKTPVSWYEGTPVSQWTPEQIKEASGG
ncbi:branched-chain amino acid transport system substrate-binding protein [Rhodococcus sp. 27YEA15]|uniref:ABC transporter substrate-binding protein n=1 Tax=Rhodococcus sp. 27YEA15 TaxID=3156259 RepID=UPI003C7D545A